MDPERGNCPPRSVFSHCRASNQQVSSVSGIDECGAAELLVLGVSLGVGAASPWCGLGSGSCKSSVCIWEWELQVLGVVDLGVGDFSSWCG